jgi:hypothetical protein
MLYDGSCRLVGCVLSGMCGVWATQIGWRERTNSDGSFGAGGTWKVWTPVSQCTIVLFLCDISVYSALLPILRSNKVSEIYTKRGKIGRSTSNFEPLNWHVAPPAWPAVVESLETMYRALV